LHPRGLRLAAPSVELAKATYRRRAQNEAFYETLYARLFALTPTASATPSWRRWRNTIPGRRRRIGMARGHGEWPRLPQEPGGHADDCRN
jgi:hypothetical protein